MNAAAVPCRCPTCRQLDLTHPGEGRQLRLIAAADSGDRSAARGPAPFLDPDTPAAVTAGASATSGRIVEMALAAPSSRRRPLMTKPAAAAKPARAKLSLAPTVKRPAAVPAIPAAPPARDAQVVPTAPRIFSLAQLVRAPENVRHIRADEDVGQLAADIARHGLLQSLIGYEQPGADRVQIRIVGGGRRLQALEHLRWENRIDGEFPVAVLVRGIEEAIELSLAENLQQRTMSPVDEFLAFRALMAKGDTSPADLAKRFGFSEAVVKQRLRLAELAPPILDALGKREITLDAAIAYASTQDRDLQTDVFTAQAKRGWEPHRPANIRSDIRLQGMRTDDPVFRYIGAAAYEQAGGGYEDNLFAEGEDPQAHKSLDRPILAQAEALRQIELEAPALIEQAKADPRYSDTIVGHVVPADLRLRNGRASEPLRVPKGFVEIDRRYDSADKVWKTIRNNGIPATIVIGIDDNGCLSSYMQRLFVPRGQKNAVDPKQVAPSSARLSPEEQAAAIRRRDLATIAQRLAVGPFADTRFEGRTFWQTFWQNGPTPKAIDGVPGWLVPVNIWVSDAEIAAQAEAAEALYAEQLAARARDEAAAAAELAS